MVDCQGSPQYITEPGTRLIVKEMRSALYVTVEKPNKYERRLITTNCDAEIVILEKFKTGGKLTTVRKLDGKTGNDKYELKANQLCVLPFIDNEVLDKEGTIITVSINNMAKLITINVLV